MNSITLKLQRARSMKLLAAVMLLGASEIIQAMATSGGSKITVVNNSNAPIMVSMVGALGTVTSSVITPASSGGVVYKKDTYSSVTVTYYQADGKTALDTAPLTFAPTAIATTLDVYGNNAVAITALDATVAATQLPSRYAAWWTGNINTTTDATAAAAIADTTGAGKLVSLYMMSLDGKSTLTF